MKRTIEARPWEKGIALFVSLLAGVVMLGLALPFLFKLTGQFRITERSHKGLAAMNLAEAGVERAIWELNCGDITSWSGDLFKRSLTLTSVETAQGLVVGNVEIEVQNPASDNPFVTAKGIVPWVGGAALEKTVRVDLGHETESYFNFGIFGDEGFDLHGNAYIDSYNSTLAPYDPLNPGQKGDVGTNATHQWDVVLLNNTVVNGDAVTGFESDPDLVVQLQNNASVTGDLTTLPEIKSLPPYTPPLLTEKGNFYLDNDSPPVTITESGAYTGFTMGTNTKVTISGDVKIYVNGDFIMNSNSILEIAPGSNVELILGNGIFRQESNTQVNNLTYDPKSLAILGTEEFNTMIWRSNSQFWGVIYVPEATIDYAANADLFGSIACNYISMSSNTGIHYDESLGSWDKYGTPSGKLQVKSWQERR